MIERPSHLGSLTFVSAPQESTSFAERTPRMAEKFEERPRNLAHSGYFFGGIGHPERELTPRNSPTTCRLGAVASLVCPVAVFTPEQREPTPGQ